LTFDKDADATYVKQGENMGPRCVPRRKEDVNLPPVLVISKTVKGLVHSIGNAISARGVYLYTSFGVPSNSDSVSG
jgi:hypothetical protein